MREHTKNKRTQELFAMAIIYIIVASLSTKTQSSNVASLTKMYLDMEGILDHSDDAEDAIRKFRIASRFYPTHTSCLRRSIYDADVIVFCKPAASNPECLRFLISLQLRGLWHALWRAYSVFQCHNHSYLFVMPRCP